MILFVGNREKGYFCEEAGVETAYLDSSLHIQEQTSDILKYKEDAEAIVYDIEQYADEPEEILNWILKVQDAIRAKTIIFASGYSPQSNIIQLLYQNGVKNFILSLYLSEQKEDLELCISGYYQSFGYEEKRGYTFEAPEPEEEEEDDSTKTICIGIAGAIERMGTTTQAIQLIKYFHYAGYKAAYFEMNNHHFVKDLSDAYAGVDQDENIGCVTYQGVDMYYRLDKLPEVKKKDYDYLVFDFGVYGENAFNKVSFLEKEIQIFVVGSKPGGEFEQMYKVVKNNFYNNVYYIFNFVAKQEEKDLLDLMEDKASVTYFAKEAKDMFSFDGEDSFYSKMLSIEQKTEETKKKRSFLPKRRKKQ